MKRIFTFLLLVTVAQAFAQTYPVTSITISLPANPDANTANWGTSTSQFIITATTQPVNGRVDGHVQESKILVQIKKGGSKVCGAYTNSSAPASGFNAVNKVWSGANAVSLLGTTCILPPGNYEVSVQFFSYGAVTRALSDEKTKAFTIRGSEQQVYQAPQNAAPANGTIYKEADMPKPITFRWTPLIPRPQEPVTYRLRVWQLMQGQNGTQAMKTNQPVITKDVDNLTQTIVTNIITGPCKPPYLCNFAWNVQALNRDGKHVGSTSELFTFKYDIPAKEENAVYLGLRMPANGSILKAGVSPQFTWLLPITTPGGPFTYKIKIVEVTGDPVSAQGIHTNKPFFERDSSLELHTNKPHFEKDSIRDKFVQYPPSAPALKAGSTYSWAIQALNREGKPIGTNNGTSEVFTFKVEGKPTDVASPALKLSLPANGANIPAGETTRFTWLPPMPSIPAGGSYKIKIVEIKGDESPAQAIHTNKPIFERDTMMSLSVQIPPSSPFKPGQKYAWSVQAKGRDGKPIGGNNGTSEVWTFSTAGAAAGTPLRLSFPANGTELSEGDRPKFTWLPPTPTIPRGNMYKIRIVEIKGDESPAQAIHTNKPIFERDTMMSLSVQYPPSAPAFEAGKVYAWAVMLNRKWSEAWIIRPYPGKLSCKDLKVNIVPTNRDEKKGCCFTISITTKYNNKLLTDKPSSIRIRSTNPIISAAGTPAGWNRTPAGVPPVTNTITWRKSAGVIPAGTITLGNICFRDIKGKPFYVVYEWLNKAGRVICKDSVRLTCDNETASTACCRYGLFFTNNQSNALFHKIRLTPIGTTKITESSVDEDVWVETVGLNYSSITYSALTGAIPLIPIEEENIYFAVDPTSSPTPKVKVEWIDNAGNVAASQELSLPCYAENMIEDETIDWDSFTQKTSGNQQNVFASIGQVPCGQQIYKTADECPEITYTLSCDGNNNTILTINRPTSNNPLFEWMVNGVSKGGAQSIAITPAPDNSYEVQLIQSIQLKTATGQDSTIEVYCTTEKTINIHHPNPNFITVQIGKPCPDFKVSFIYTDISNLFNSADSTYLWTFKLGGNVVGTSTNKNPLMTFTDAGTYDVTIEVTSNWGCKYTRTSQLVLSYTCDAKLDWKYTWCDDGKVEGGQTYPISVTFVNTSTGGKCPKFEINFGNGYVPFNNPSIIHQFTGTPGATFPVKLRMLDEASGSVQQCDSATFMVKIKPLLVTMAITPCPNGDIVLNTTAPNPEWRFPGANNEMIFTALHKNESTVTPNYNPGTYTVTLESYDPATHAFCSINRTVVAVDICCDEQKSLQPFYNTINGRNYKIRGKFKVEYKHLFNWSGIGPLNKHTKLIVKTLAFKEKTKKNGNKRWKRFRPDQISAGVSGDFFNKGVSCDCDNLNHFDGGDGGWDWWVRGVRYWHNLYQNGTNYIRWNSAKSVHKIEVDGVPWEVNIYLGQLDCTQ